MGDGVAVFGEFADAAGNHQVAVGVALGLHEFEKDRLIGEDVLRVAVEVVEAEEVVVEEAGRPGGRDDVGRANLFGEPQGAGKLVVALLAAQRVHHLLRVEVDHRVPDGAGELEEMGVVGAEVGQHIEIDRARVVLVEDAHLAIVHAEAGVAERAIGGGDGGGDHEAQAIDGDGHAVLGAQEFGEADLAQAAFEQVERVVGQEDGGLFGDVLAQKFGVEVVVVQMRDEEVVGLAICAVSMSSLLGKGNHEAK